MRPHGVLTSDSGRMSGHRRIGVWVSIINWVEYAPLLRTTAPPRMIRSCGLSVRTSAIWLLDLSAGSRFSISRSFAAREIEPFQLPDFVPAPPSLLFQAIPHPAQQEQRRMFRLTLH